jgi:hypothetical protein
LCGSVGVVPETVEHRLKKRFQRET